MKVHNKLVRDNIPKIVAKNGGTAHTRTISDNSEYISELINKLIEEAHEVASALSLEELADVQEVLDTLTITLGHTKEEVQSAQTEKAIKNGRFNDRIFLISTEG